MACMKAGQTFRKSALLAFQNKLPPIPSSFNYWFASIVLCLCHNVILLLKDLSPTLLVQLLESDKKVELWRDTSYCLSNDTLEQSNEQSIYAYQKIEPPELIAYPSKTTSKRSSQEEKTPRRLQLNARQSSFDFIFLESQQAFPWLSRKIGDLPLTTTMCAYRDGQKTHRSVSYPSLKANGQANQKIQQFEWSAITIVSNELEKLEFGEKWREGKGHCKYKTAVPIQPVHAKTEPGHIWKQGEPF